MMQGWRHGGEQHDIRDFFEHLLSRCQVSPFHGTWEARVLEAGRCNVHDRGMCEHSLTLDVPEHGTWHLQDLIGAWRGHAFPQGLTSAPQWLAIRLNRFKFESGRMQKLRSEMMWSDHVNMPLFIGGNLETHDVPYEFTAFAIHLGGRTCSIWTL